ncbi:hypothetical protein B0J17DRAFT_720535 [Rhizoctonia solani]|nr:hypothetical protein B0J17DRAFT_720535 [Rhizoctonia solani]
MSLTHSQFNASRIAVVTSASRYEPFLDFITATRGQSMIARYLAVSGIALLVYDWLTNLDKEVEYAWSRKWTLARVVYHLNRVLPIVLIGVVLIANILLAPTNFTSSTSVQKLNLVVQLRRDSDGGHRLHHFGYSLLGVVWSTMGSVVRSISCSGRACKLSPLRVLILSLIVSIGHATFRVTMIVSKAHIMSNKYPELFQGCLISIPNDMWLVYVSGVFFELVVFCILVWRIWYLGHRLGLTSLMKELLKNDTSFFAINLALILFSCVGSAHSSIVIVADGSGVLTALSSVICSSIFFSMHDFARGDQVRVSPGSPLTTGARGRATISAQFAIPMETFSDGSWSLSGTHVAFTTPPQSSRQPVSKDKDMTKDSDKLSV